MAVSMIIVVLMLMMLMMVVLGVKMGVLLAVLEMLWVLMLMRMVLALLPQICRSLFQRGIVAIDINPQVERQVHAKGTAAPADAYSGTNSSAPVAVPGPAASDPDPMHVYMLGGRCERPLRTGICHEEQTQNAAPGGAAPVMR